MRQRGVTDVGGVELLAGHGGADDRKNAGADNRADSERRERPGAKRLLEGVPGLFRIPDQLIDGLSGNKLFEQGGSPGPVRCGTLRVRYNSPALVCITGDKKVRISRWRFSPNSSGPVRLAHKHTKEKGHLRGEVKFGSRPGLEGTPGTPFTCSAAASAWRRREPVS